MGASERQLLCACLRYACVAHGESGYRRCFRGVVLSDIRNQGKYFKKLKNKVKKKGKTGER